MRRGGARKATLPHHHMQSDYKLTAGYSAASPTVIAYAVSP
jgi:hypothetical protein